MSHHTTRLRHRGGSSARARLHAALTGLAGALWLAAAGPALAAPALAAPEDAAARYRIAPFLEPATAFPEMAADLAESAPGWSMPVALDYVVVAGVRTNPFPARGFSLGLPGWLDFSSEAARQIMFATPFGSPDLLSLRGNTAASNGASVRASLLYGINTLPAEARLRGSDAAYWTSLGDGPHGTGLITEIDYFPFAGQAASLLGDLRLSASYASAAQADPARRGILGSSTLYLSAWTAVHF